jgi:cytochrome c biogenesis factor
MNDGGRAEFLQWFGLLGAALVWAAQHVSGFGVTVARCGAASSVFSIDQRTWEITLMAIALSLALLAEGAALSVLRATREVDYEAPGPEGRRHFFALAAALGNLLFLVIIVLSGVSTIVHAGCRPA